MGKFVDIGRRLEEERKRLGLNQEGFAELGGVGRKTQFNYESGERSPDGGYLSDIAKHGADVLYIITGMRSMPPVLSVEQEQAGYAVAVLNRKELALVDNYRHSSDKGKEAIEKTGTAVEKQIGKKKAG